MIDRTAWIDCIPNGWHELFTNMCAEINAACEKLGVGDTYQVIDVKEKYGYMCIYDWMKNYTNVPQKIRDIVNHYECESVRTCPICGKRKLPEHDMCIACAHRYEEMADGVIDYKMLP